MSFATYGYGVDTDVLGSIALRGYGIDVVTPLVPPPPRFVFIVSEEDREVIIKEELRGLNADGEIRTLVTDDEGRQAIALGDCDPALDPALRQVTVGVEHRGHSIVENREVSIFDSNRTVTTANEVRAAFVSEDRDATIVTEDRALTADRDKDGVTVTDL